MKVAVFKDENDGAFRILLSPENEDDLKEISEMFYSRKSIFSAHSFGGLVDGAPIKSKKNLRKHYNAHTLELKERR